MEKKDKKGKNYYKYATFVLVAIIVVVGMFFALSLYQEVSFNKGYQFGQERAFVSMIDSINKEGSITFTNGNYSLTLVPAQQIQMAREQTILEVMSYIDKEGYVSLFNNETEMILVEYQPPVKANTLSMDAMVPSGSQDN